MRTHFFGDSAGEEISNGLQIIYRLMGIICRISMVVTKLPRVDRNYHMKVEPIFLIFIPKILFFHDVILRALKVFGKYIFPLVL